MERIHSIDFMKFIAIYLVVCLHSMVFSSIAPQNPLIVFDVNFFPRFVIPFFFLIAGFLLGQKLKTVKEPKKYFIKYLLKIIKLFVAWFLFYMVYDCTIRMAVALHSGSDIISPLMNYFSNVLHFSLFYYGGGVSSFHLWYLTALIWSLIILYTFVIYNKLNVLLILSFILNIAGLAGQSYSGLFHLGIQTTDALFFGLFYTTLGCFFAINYEKLLLKLTGIKTSLLILLIMLFSLMQIAERYITLTWFNGQNSEINYYFSTIPLTICLFLIIIKHPQWGRGTLFNQLGMDAVGIYVSHILFISMTFIIVNHFGLAIIYRYLTFHVLFSILVVFSAHYFYISIQIIKMKLRSLLLTKRSPVKGEEVSKTS